MHESIKYLPHGQLVTVPSLCKELSNKSWVLEVLLSYWFFYAHEKVIMFISVDEKNPFYEKIKGKEKT